MTEAVEDISVEKLLMSDVSRIVCAYLKLPGFKQKMEKHRVGGKRDFVNFAVKFVSALVSSSVRIKGGTGESTLKEQLDVYGSDTSWVRENLFATLRMGLFNRMPDRSMVNLHHKDFQKIINDLKVNAAEDGLKREQMTQSDCKLAAIVIAGILNDIGIETRILPLSFYHPVCVVYLDDKPSHLLDPLGTDDHRFSSVRVFLADPQFPNLFRVPGNPDAVPKRLDTVARRAAQEYKGVFNQDKSFPMEFGPNAIRILDGLYASQLVKPDSLP